MSKKINREKRQTINQKHASKKAVILEAEKKKNPVTFIVILVCAVLLILGGVSFFKMKGKVSQTFAKTDEVILPVTLFDDGKARHFQLQTEDGILIKYFILKRSDGVIRTAFDACDVCWPRGKGYYQQGDFMVCRNCGRSFASVKVNEVKGGCNPAPLKRRVEGENLVILAKDIIEGRQYFDFSKRS